MDGRTGLDWKSPGGVMVLIRTSRDVGALPREDTPIDWNIRVLGHWMLMELHSIYTFSKAIAAIILPLFLLGTSPELFVCLFVACTV